MTLRQLWCAVFGGHLPVTKSGDGVRYEQCFICERRLGPGWDVRDLALPLPKTHEPKAVTRPRSFEEWTRRYAGRCS